MSDNDKGASRIAAECDAIKELLLRKNTKYGDSWENPLHIFSQADSVEQLRVSIDHKLKRILNVRPEDDDEDAVLDLIGYLVLLRVATAKPKPAKLPTINGMTIDETIPERQYAGAGPRNRWDYPQASTDYFRGQSSKKGEK